jgi:hypothetical protein
MKIALKVSSSNPYDNGGCELALLELTSELAALALGRIAALRERKNIDPDIDEIYYWANFVEYYFDPWLNPASAENEVQAANLGLADKLAEIGIEEKGIATVPGDFQVLPNPVAAVECEQMIVRQEGIAFSAIPKHASFYIHTAEIPLAMLEAAVVQPASG